MATRLDRLVLLLDTGSTPAVRTTAAKQLGDIQRQHPDDLYHLLARVLVHLRSKSWETRAAAGQAIEAIAKNVPQWDPPPAQSLPADAVIDGNGNGVDDDGLYAFANFDIENVVKNGAPLLASAGKEFDLEFGTGDDADLDPKERIARAKKMLKKQLGLADFMDVDFFEESDVTSHHATASTASHSQQQQDAQQVMRTSVKTQPVKEEPTSEVSMEGLSARERNVLKRKARMMGKEKAKEKVRVVDISSSSALKKRKSVYEQDTSTTTPPKPVPTPIKVEQISSSPTTTSSSPIKEEKEKLIVDPSKEKEDPLKATLTFSSGDEWPFEGLCEQLCLDLFHPQWEIRHGAAIGLREVIKVHGSGAGKIVGVSVSENAKRHSQWLEDVGIHFLCVLALDRFADFLGDQAVIPVRETVAQGLGVLVKWCSGELAVRILEEGVLKLVEGGENVAKGGEKGRWEVRHGALVGLKYWMAVRKDLVGVVMVPGGGEGETRVFRAVINGLKDTDDDVRSVTSTTLLPISNQLVDLLPIQTIFHSIIETLWDCLTDLDDLTAATSSVMDLLSQLSMNPRVAAVMRTESLTTRSLDKLVPRLYPFFRHAIPAVRVAVIKTLGTLVAVDLDSAAATTAGTWITVDLLSLLFQNFLLEERSDIVNATLEVWTSVLTLLEKREQTTLGTYKSLIISSPTPTIPPALATWMGLVMTPMGHMIDLKLFHHYTSVSSLQTGKKSIQRAALGEGLNVSPHDKAMATQDLTIVSKEDVVRGRIAGATALGRLCAVLLETRDEGVTTQIRERVSAFLNSGWVGQRVFSAVVVEEMVGFWEGRKSSLLDVSSEPTFSKVIYDQLCGMLQEWDSAGGMPLFWELVSGLDGVRNECGSLMAVFREFGVKGAELPPVQSSGGVKENGQKRQQQQSVSSFGDSFTIPIAEYVATEYFTQLLAHVPNAPMDSTPRGTKGSKNAPPQTDRHTHLLDRQRRLLYTIDRFKTLCAEYEAQAMSCIACAVVRFGKVPGRLNPVVRALMDGVKREGNGDVRERAARGVAGLVGLLADGKKGVVDKIVRNLAVGVWNGVKEVGEGEGGEEGIETLKEVGGAGPVEEGKGKGKGGATKGKKRKGGAGVDVDVDVPSDVAEVEAREKVAKEVQRMGSESGFRAICEKFGERMFDVVPKVWDVMSTTLLSLEADSTATFAKLRTDPELRRDIANALYLTGRISPYIHTSLHPTLQTLLPPIVTSLRAPSPLIRHQASKSLASLCAIITIPTMHIIVGQVVHLMGDATSVTNRQGATEAIYHVVQTLSDAILPYVVFLIVPILSRMSDPNHAIRFLSTNVFASLVKLMPLESGVPDPEGFDEGMVRMKREERKFLGQLVGSEKVDGWEVPGKVEEGLKGVELRGYQREGVSWLMFLGRYGLHGVLCDDMGLGKTLQSICALASDHCNRAEKYAKTGAADCRHAPSLVVCPPTLTGHWKNEVETFASFLRVGVYVGTVSERTAIRKDLSNLDIIVTSYEVLRNDIDQLSPIRFNYCILDEGHIIKNPKTKLTKAVKQIQANHRLILSGTPIQNNVLELWSLFDFLMPGFLGSEREFNEKYGKPILASRDAKSSSREQERGALAMEGLHKQVLPFLMRRMKEDVLRDLPPKIVQDWECELSWVQRELYEGFGREVREGGLGGEDGEEGKGTGGGKKGHVFQALQYLRKVCNHPGLVLTEGHPRYEELVGRMKKEGMGLSDLRVAPKIEALRQLLLDCGIGTDASDTETTIKIEKDPLSTLTPPTVSQHRALIFAQHTTMLDIIERDLFRPHLPTVTFLRLDGSVPASERTALVKKFNEDPSIDVLLLTTHVGGLGLTLTGADTVIFVEHDWNPMKDLQAMDRAHRLGQKSVVSVYRLVTRGTLEEKIMGLQKFKLNIASSVINQDNAGLKSMNPDQILDLFSLDDSKGKKEKKKEGGGDGAGKKASVKEVLEGLGDVWDEKEYEEFGVEGFLEGLK
ncbi:btaf1 RNA polymerase II, B-TFIID transcription factor-associated, 170kDa [Rhizophlyctis rosea]|nr:btaf1 RNA polymerase II, B-TFIID transcription factor-associated, 170kDa [Rhizophlyctis rosea]